MVNSFISFTHLFTCSFTAPSLQVFTLIVSTPINNQDVEGTRRRLEKLLSMLSAVKKLLQVTNEATTNTLHMNFHPTLGILKTTYG